MIISSSQRIVSLVDKGVRMFKVSFLLRHLREDILRFWTLPTMLGTPIGNFPTFADMNGIPCKGKMRYTRMQGRQTYVYWASYSVLREPYLLTLGEAGLKWLITLKNPRGGYYSMSTEDGQPLQCSASIQDQCYCVFPFLMAYQVTGNKIYFREIEAIVDFILNGPYCVNGSLIDALTADYSTQVPFEGRDLNLVSVLDFLNVVYIPALQVAPAGWVTRARKLCLQRLIRFMLEKFYARGIFWNNAKNREDPGAKHVDFGHTSKAYGVLLDANRLFRSWNMPELAKEIEYFYPTLALAAANPQRGWDTDFDKTLSLFSKESLQWWRHIIIDQVVARYSVEYPSLLPLLYQGVSAWFKLDYIDRTRSCRGIREGLTIEGHPYGNENMLTAKANLWKNGYHEVEHVLTLLKYMSFE